MKRNATASLNQRLGLEQPLLFWSALFALVTFFTLGGGPMRPGLAFAAMFLAGLWVLCVSFWTGGWAVFQAQTLAVRLLIAIIALLPMLQLLPLPPALLQFLPGRGLEREIVTLTGYSGVWLPLTVDFSATISSALMALAMLGMLLAALMLTKNETKSLVWAIAALIVTALLVGIVQSASGGSALDFYGSAHRGFALGFLANRNHMGLLLACGIPVTAFCVSSLRMPVGQARLIFCLVAIVLLAGIIATASRAAIALGLLAFALSALTQFRFRDLSKTAIGLAVAGSIAIGATVLQFGGAAGKAVDRYDQVSGDYRWTIWQRSWTMLGDYWPWGSGVGTFQNVYEKYEQPGWLRPTYMNHVHNDYIEILLEGGVLSGILLVGLLSVYLRRTVSTVRLVGAERVGGATATRLLGSIVAGLILLHSVVDYPLRRPAMLALFVLAFAWLCRRDVNAVRQAHPGDAMIT